MRWEQERECQSQVYSYVYRKSAGTVNSRTLVHHARRQLRLINSNGWISQFTQRQKLVSQIFFQGDSNGLPYCTTAKTPISHLLHDQSHTNPCRSHE